MAVVASSQLLRTESEGGGCRAGAWGRARLTFSFFPRLRFLPPFPLFLGMAAARRGLVLRCGGGWVGGSRGTKCERGYLIKRRGDQQQAHNAHMEG